MLKNRYAMPGSACLVFILLAGLFACANRPVAFNGKPVTEGSQNANEAPQPKYLDFNDILIPSELKINTSTSFVFRTTDITAGVLALKGRVDSMSLVEFFEANMQKDNWKFISTFKSPKTLMLFRKDTRWCVINVFDGDYYTYAEVWVSPTIGDKASGLIK